MNRKRVVALLLMAPILVGTTSRCDLARSDILSLQTHLDIYYAKTSHYPDAVTGLAGLLSKGILERSARPGK